MTVEVVERARLEETNHLDGPARFGTSQDRHCGGIAASSAGYANYKLLSILGGHPMFGL